MLVKKCPFLDSRSLGRILSKSPSKYKIREFKQESQAEMEKQVFLNKKNNLYIDLDGVLVKKCPFWMPGP